VRECGGVFTNRLLWLSGIAGVVSRWGSGCRNLALPCVYEHTLAIAPLLNYPIIQKAQSSASASEETPAPTGCGSLTLSYLFFNSAIFSAKCQSALLRETLLSIPLTGRVRGILEPSAFRLS